VRRANRSLRAAIFLGALAAVAIAVASGQGTIGATTPFGPLPLDHFACYSATFSNFKPRPVRLENQFGKATARVLRPIRICAPAQKNAEPMRNRIAHLTCYALTGVQGPEQQSRTVTLTNQFGVLPAKVLVVPPESLCLPASKRLGTLTPPSAVPKEPRSLRLLQDRPEWAVRAQKREGPRSVRLVHGRHPRPQDALRSDAQERLEADPASRAPRLLQRQVGRTGTGGAPP